MDGADLQYERETEEWYFKCVYCSKETSIPMILIKNKEPRVCEECLGNNEVKNGK